MVTGKWLGYIDIVSCLQNYEFEYQIRSRLKIKGKKDDYLHFRIQKTYENGITKRWKKIPFRHFSVLTGIIVWFSFHLDQEIFLFSQDLLVARIKVIARTNKDNISCET